MHSIHLNNNLHIIQSNQIQSNQIQSNPMTPISTSTQRETYHYVASRLVLASTTSMIVTSAQDSTKSYTLHFNIMSTKIINGKPHIVLKHKMYDDDTLQVRTIIHNINCGSLIELYFNYSNDLPLYQCEDDKYRSNLIIAKLFMGLTHIHASRSELKVLDMFYGSHMTLKSLDLTSTKITSLLPLSRCLNLEVLQIADTEIDSVEPLKDCLKLRNLICNNTKINTLTPLADCRLMELDCSNTLVTSLLGISGTYLIQLNICDTFVSDLSTVAKFDRLQRIYISKHMVVSTRMGCQVFRY
jgi:hypothetical protein